VNRKHRRTLSRIFAQPTPADIPWADITGLIVALGGELRQRSGSRVAFALAGCLAVIHSPQPERQTPQSRERAVRDLLEAAGIRPDEE
jgi:hypothetical protein